MTTICNVLNKNQEKIFSLLNESKVEESRQLVLNLLNVEELKNNKDVPKAKAIFTKCKNNENLYMSTLITYLTCIKAY